MENGYNPVTIVAELKLSNPDGFNAYIEGGPAEECHYNL